MAADYLWHVTLTSGHAVQQHRGCMDQIALARAGGLLAEALAGGEPKVTTGYDLRAEARGSNLTGTLWAGETLIMTTGVALRSRSAPGLWRHLHDTADARLGPLATDREAPPAAPWIADRIEAGMAQAIQVAGRTQEWDAIPAWTGAWSALLGWAWMERNR